MYEIFSLWRGLQCSLSLSLSKYFEDKYKDEYILNIWHTLQLCPLSIRECIVCLLLTIVFLWRRSSFRAILYMCTKRVLLGAHMLTQTASTNRFWLSDSIALRMAMPESCFGHQVRVRRKEKIKRLRESPLKSLDKNIKVLIKHCQRHNGPRNWLRDLD